MSYILKRFDEDLLRFDMEKISDDIEVKILSVNERGKWQLPLDLVVTEPGLKEWIKRRIVPKGRGNISELLKRLGIDGWDYKAIADYSKLLSVIDPYWVVKEGFAGTFKENNLFDNPISREISLFAFLGKGDIENPRTKSSPEFTTNGMLTKGWRRDRSTLYLYKGGTEGRSIPGLEPYVEFYAAEILEKMGIRHVPYDIRMWEGKLASVCPSFTSKEYSFLSAGHLVGQGGLAKAMEIAKSVGEECYQSFLAMLTFDAIVIHEDRHLYNFGFLVENKTNRLVSLAPLFDHGLSLLVHSSDSELKDVDACIRKRKPFLYEDFMGYIKPLIGDRQREKARRLLDFSFKKHPRYNLSDGRLLILEKMVRGRAKALLD